MANYKKAGPLSRLLMGICFILTGGSLVFIDGLPNIYKAHQSSSWSSTNGYVTESKIYKKRSSSSKKNKFKYTISLAYTYEANGKQFNAHQIFFGETKSTSSKARSHAVIEKYPTDSDITVYYDPQEPSQAVLEPGIQSVTYLPLGLGLIFLLVGCFLPLLDILFLAKKNKHQENHANENKNENSITKTRKRKKTSMVKKSHTAKKDSPDDSPEKYEWYIYRDNEKVGPYNIEKIKKMVKQKEISPEDQCKPSKAKGVRFIKDILAG